MTATTVSVAPTYSPATSTGSFAPTRPDERIQTLDVLRGFAMFGVLWSNLNDWYGVVEEVRWSDWAIGWTQNWLLESRFYTLLAFLFGIGFAMQLIRAESSGTDARWMYMRRLTVLLGFGVAHGFILWSGDILTGYALMGFVLLLFRDLKPRGLLIAAVAMAIILPWVIGLLFTAFHTQMIPRAPHTTADWIYGHGTVRQVFAARAGDYLDWLGRWPSRVYPPWVALFILGLYVGRKNFVRNLAERLGTVRRAFWIALGVTIVGVLCDLYLGKLWPRPRTAPTGVVDYLIRSPRFLVAQLTGNLSTWGMAALYGSALTLLVHRPGWSGRLAPLAAAGRMPLTTYLTQSVVCNVLFSSYGLGWFGTRGYTGMFLLTLVLFSAQMAASVWWLKRYRFGPAEWVWRSLSYGRRQEMRLVET